MCRCVILINTLSRHHSWGNCFFSATVIGHDLSRRLLSEHLSLAGSHPAQQSGLPGGENRPPQMTFAEDFDGSARGQKNLTLSPPRGTARMGSRYLLRKTGCCFGDAFFPCLTLSMAIDAMAGVKTIGKMGLKTSLGLRRNRPARRDR